MRYGKECVCGRGEECKGISAAFALLKDPRRGYVALPPFSANPVEYTDSDMNDMRAAYLRHLNVSEESLGDSMKRRYVALHHFHPTVVQKHSQMKNAVSPIPKTLKKVDLRFLKMKLGDDDRVRDENGKKRKSYYFVPTYPIRKVKDDLKHMIRVSRLYAEAKIGTVPSPVPPRRRQMLPSGESSKEDGPTTAPLEKEKGNQIGDDNVPVGKTEKDDCREKDSYEGRANRNDYKEIKVHENTKDPEELNVRKEIEISKEPELPKDSEIPKELHINRKIEVSEDLDLKKRIKISEEPHTNKEIEFLIEPGVNKKIEFSKEPSAKKDVAIFEEPKIYKDIKIPEEPTAHKDMALSKEFNICKEIELLDEPEIHEGKKLPEEIEVHKEIKLSEKPEAQKQIKLLQERGVHEANKLSEESEVHGEIKFTEDPEVHEEIKLPEELEIHGEIKLPQEPEAHMETKLPEGREVHKETKLPEEHEVHEELKFSEESEVHEEIKFPEEPGVHEEIKFSEEPEDDEIKFPEKPKVHKENNFSEEPEAREEIELPQEPKGQNEIENLVKTETYKELEKKMEAYQEKNNIKDNEDYNKISCHMESENDAFGEEEEEEKNDGDNDPNYDIELDDEKLSPLPVRPPLAHQLSGVQPVKSDHLNRNISQSETVGFSSNQDDVPEYARMSMLLQADTQVFSNKRSPSLKYNVSQAETVGASNQVQIQGSFTDTQTSLTDIKPRDKRASYSRPSRQPFVKKSNDPILDIIIDTSEIVEKKADDLHSVDVLDTLEDLDEADSEVVEDEPLNLSERIFDHIWPEENLPSNMTMHSEEGRKFLFCRMATFEAYRHQVCAPLIQKFHARWRASLEVMQAGIFETARAERLIRGNALANKAFSEAMQAMYDDIYLDEEGQLVSGKRIQQRLAKEREGLSYTVEGGPGSTQENGEAHTKSALLGSLVDSQAVLAEKFSSHGHLVTDEVVTELSNLRSYLKTQMLDFKRKGDPLMREIQDSEAEILGAFSIFELIGAIPADYDGASMHSLNASRHTLQADGSWHGTPGSISSYKDIDDADDNSIRRGFFTKKLKNMSSRTADQSLDNNSIGGATADTTTSIRFLSNPNSPLHAAIRANAIVRDGWLAEMLYRQAVNSQVMILKKCGAGLEEISNSMRRIEVNRQARIHELLLDFMPRQRRLYLGLSSISAPILSDLTSLRVDNEQLGRQVEDALKQHMQVLLKEDSAQRSSIMNRSRAQAPNLEDLHGVLTGEFFDNGLLRAATIMERRSGVRGYWKPTLAVVTSDQYLHMFDLSFLPEVSIGTPPEFVFEMLLPDYDLPTIEGESVISRVDSLLKNLTPEITIHLVKCSSTGIANDSRSLEIVEEIKGRIITNTTRRFVLRAQEYDEADQWLALLRSFESECTHNGEFTGEPMQVEEIVDNGS